MPPVTHVVRNARQPQGGYVNPRGMTKTGMESGTRLSPRENISPAMMGLIVDYMSRYAMTGDPADAFAISLRGAMTMDRAFPSEGHYDRAISLLLSMDGITSSSIEAAYQLVSYDCAFRIGPQAYVDMGDLGPDAATSRNAVEMIHRTIRFAKRFGPIVAEGMTFAGGYTEAVSSGDADFCTADTLWDMKVSKYPPTKEHTLQLMVYYLMARHAGCDWAEGIGSIGIWNPRLDAAWTKRIDKIGKRTIDEIERDVIGY